MTDLRSHFEQLRAGGQKLLVPYLMGGVPDRATWPDAFAAVAASADAVEVGLPFSDPLMDGPVIAAAGERAIRAGNGPLEVLASMGGIPGGPPRVVMTYYNPIHRIGEGRFCDRAAASGFSGLIVPDLPHEESTTLRAAARKSGLAWIPLVAPTTPPARIEKVVEEATGFVYAVSTMGVTGLRTSLSESAHRVVGACRDATDAPVLIGIGVSTPEQAVEAATVADGVVIGSAVVRLLVDQGPEAAGHFLARVRSALGADHSANSN